ncbi:MAG: HAMP domain-containing histidine kinase [Bacteroidetes bacterium]|nr:HAMP domain-containing histidine kinase [Bacteroidota bacterium]
MKIRNKLALRFTLLSGILLLGVLAFTYVFTVQYFEYEFFERLEERARIVAQSRLEKDELSASVYERLLNKHFQKLPKEQEWLVPVNAPLHESPLSVLQNTQLLAEVLTEGKGHLKTDDGVYYSALKYEDNQGDFIVVVSAEDSFGQSKLNFLMNLIIIAYVSGLGIIYLLSRYYAGQMLKPISQISNQARSIGANQLHQRLPTGNGKDELAELARTFNDMLERLAHTFELQAYFVNNASHELNTPLTVIMGEAEYALNKPRTIEAYLESLQTIGREAERLDSILQSLLLLSQTGFAAESTHMEPVPVEALLTVVKANLDRHYPQNRVNLDIRHPVPSICGNWGLLQVALHNLLDNACKFAANGPVQVSVFRDAGWVHIAIQDDGEGIPGAELKHVGEPFYRATNVRAYKGSGLGLALARKIALFHKGSLQVAAAATGGTVATLLLPVQQENI